VCGIAGFYKFESKNEDRSKVLIQAMTDKIEHRGPDDQGYFVSQKVSLGHRRLSILDLSPLGHQPMFYNELAIVFNGEIYNYLEIKAELIKKGYKFKSHSDTEVILVSFLEWGDDCLAKFNGMFSFVIYNQKTETFFAARDRLGIKPFYYYQNDEAMVFASEIKALLVYPGVKVRPNQKIIWDYLVGGLVGHTHETFFSGIKELAPGHFLTIKNNQLEVKKYWNLADNKVEVPKTEAEQIEKFRSLFMDSVRIRLRSDVPIGSCLSGGLDSSTIVMVINKIMREEGKVEQIGDMQKTFSAVYKDKNALYADESQFIKVVNEATGAQPYFIYPSGQDLLRDFSGICINQDEPSASTSMFAQNQVFKLVAGHKIKVVLDGQGSDELLGGYHVFVDVYFAELVQAGQFGLFFKELKEFAFNQKKSWLKIGWKFFVTYYAAPLLKKMFSLRDFANLPEYKVFDPNFLKSYKLVVPKSKLKSPFLDKSYYLVNAKTLPGYLRYEDRNSMSYAIESRLPFLDYRLVEYIFNLPNKVKIKNGQTKWILREAFKDILPSEITNRHDKMGFTVPEVYWMKNDLREEIKQVFASKEFNSRGFILPGAAKELFEDFLAGRMKNYQLIWRLFNLEIWYRKFVD